MQHIPNYIVYAFLKRKKKQKIINIYLKKNIKKKLIFT
jgi:hypothetical protein